MAVKIVAFDVHGTLARWPANRLQEIEVLQLLRRFGVPLSHLALRAARQAVFVLDAPKREIHGYVDFLALQFARMNARVSVDLLESIAAMHETRDEMELFPEALETVEAVRARGKTTCAFTTLPKFMLGRAGETLLPLLDHYFDCSTVGFAKGDPRFYERMTEALGVDAEEILCIGDDPVGDGLLPTEAGWRAVLLDRDGRFTNKDVGKIATVRTLTEFLDVVE